MAFDFDAKNPGPKEFAIVGGGTLAVVLAWRWWSKRQGTQGGTAGQPSAGTATSAAPQPGEGTTPTGLSLGALLLWLQDHMSSSTTTTTTRTPAPVPAPKPKPRPKPKPKPVSVPPRVPPRKAA